jgi:hypothetical protein
MQLIFVAKSEFLWYFQKQLSTSTLCECVVWCASQSDDWLLFEGHFTSGIIIHYLQSEVSYLVEDVVLLEQ